MYVSAILQTNSNLTVDGTPFRFGKDSNGNYGYIITDEDGADSVVPFNRGQFSDLTKGYILPLSNNKFDMKTLAPDKYKEYTTANFQAAVTKLGAYNTASNSDGGNVHTYSINQNPTCSYNPDTGIVTVNPGRNGNHITITYYGDTRLNNDFYASNTCILVFTP